MNYENDGLLNEIKLLEIEIEKRKGEIIGLEAKHKFLSRLFAKSEHIRIYGEGTDEFLTIDVCECVNETSEG